MGQNKTKFKTFKKIIGFCFCVGLVVVLGLFLIFVTATKNTNLNVDALNISSPTLLEIYDNSGNKLTLTNAVAATNISIKQISLHTQNAFISMEDKQFYKHNGINVKRMFGAVLQNIKANKIVQGGSTISQQLIKNSQLSADKTLSRKLKEIKLALDLEKQYTKPEILEMYLNTIYFGNGCYGIENASWFYFNKPTSKLNLNESATLVAVINAPTIYNPLTNLEKVKVRRNLVLSSMLKDSYITESEYNEAVNLPIIVVSSKAKNTYLKAVIEQACDLINISEADLIENKYVINTYLNSEIQNNIEKLISSNNYMPNSKDKPTLTSAIIDNITGGVCGFCSNNNVSYKALHQPGSIIKPILVYGPAIENNVVSPATKILDEPINFNGYTPHNASKDYAGFVSVRKAITKSLNIPAVKVLSYTGIEKSKDFAKKLGIKFNEQDNGYSLALGGFTDGVSILDIARAYTTFACDGKTGEVSFIKNITNADGKTIYSHNENKSQSIKESTAYLITDMLIDTSKYGTASRLKDLNFEVAAKTGTVGLEDSQNSECWSVAYTPKNTLVTNISINNSCKSLPSYVNGSTYPTILTKDILKNIYKNNAPNNFRQPSSVVSVNLDSISLENNVVIEADEYCPEKDKITELFSIDNLPAKKENNYNLANNYSFDIAYGLS